MSALELTPTQQRTLDLLRRGDDPVHFDGGAVAALVDEATAAFRQLGERVGGDPGTLIVTKHDISGILGCEASHLHRDPFDWTIRNATGTVVHRAIQLRLNWRGDPLPADLVDEALERLGDDDRSIGAWLSTCSPADVAELRGVAANAITRFEESFPPLPRTSMPVVEAKLMWPAMAPIQLRGRVDLIIGRPRGAESTKVLIDLKTGAAALTHLQDLRHYALLETLTRGVPPRMLASFYLDAAEPVVETVTMPLLASALARAVEATEALIETRFESRPPTLSPGWHCRWCAISDDCDEGLAWLEADREQPGP